MGDRIIQERREASDCHDHSHSASCTRLCKSWDICVFKYVLYSYTMILSSPIQPADASRERYYVTWVLCLQCRYRMRRSGSGSSNTNRAKNPFLIFNILASHLARGFGPLPCSRVATPVHYPHTPSTSVCLAATPRSPLVLYALLTQGLGLCVVCGGVERSVSAPSGLVLIPLLCLESARTIVKTIGSWSAPGTIYDTGTISK
eukprot:scaffold17102_cov39-Tisochrysis_lutea.AAC.2